MKTQTRAGVAAIGWERAGMIGEAFALQMCIIPKKIHLRFCSFPLLVFGNASCLLLMLTRVMLLGRRSRCGGERGQR